MPAATISDHVQRALARLVEQYKEKEDVEGLISALSGEWQNLEDVFQSMFLEQYVDTAVGEQLDRFGVIVVLDRNGFDDEFYRILLKVKIGENVSNGEPASIINNFKLLTQATLVHYQNLGNAEILLGTDNDIDDDLVDFFFTNMQRIVMAGVRINNIVIFDPNDPFSFDGQGPIGLGFSSLAAPLTGGKFAFLERRNQPQFAFDGDDSLGGGFGTIIDPIAGGIFQGL